MKQQELKQNLELRFENKPVEGQRNRKPIQISLLINSLYYFIAKVFIMVVRGRNRICLLKFLFFLFIIIFLCLPEEGTAYKE